MIYNIIFFIWTLLPNRQEMLATQSQFDINWSKPKQFSMAAVVMARMKVAAYMERRRASKKAKHKHKVIPKGHFPPFPVSLTQQCELHNAAKLLMEPGKGIFSADESVKQIDALLHSINIPGKDQTRDRYLEMLFSGSRELYPNLSGVLIKEELAVQHFHRGKKVKALLDDAGIKLGIRVDKGIVPLPGSCGEWTTSGLDDLEKRCALFRVMGATFVLWRCLYKVSWCTPSIQALTENSNTLARFALVSQQYGLIPIVSPEVLSEGEDYTPELAQGALDDILAFLIKALADYPIYLEGVIIRLKVAAPGSAWKGPFDVMKDVVEPTMRILNERVPPAVAGILIAKAKRFDWSIAYLNSLNICIIKKPYIISFCFSHVIQEGVIRMWAGLDRNIPKVQSYLVKRVRACALAAMGQYPTDCDQSLFFSNLSKY